MTMYKKKKGVSFIFKCRVGADRQEAGLSSVHTGRRVWLRWPLLQWGARGGSLSCVEVLLSADMTAGGPQCLLGSASHLQAVVRQLRGEDCNHQGRPARDSWCTESVVYLKQDRIPNLSFYADQKFKIPGLPKDHCWPLKWHFNQK